ncbi:hypothetical protein AB0I30_21715 [Nocardia tengchongensis]
MKITRSGDDHHTKLVARLRFTDPATDERDNDDDGEWEIDDPYA